MVTKPASISVTVADAKRRFSDLLGRVAFGRARVLITRRGRPMARLVPASDPDDGGGLAAVKGWLDDDDELFPAVDAAIARRARTPRIVAATRRPRARR